jgi:predicted permease
MTRDVRSAWRSLWRSPALTIASVASLTVAVAATTTVFSLVDAAIFRPPPFERADRLGIVFITRASPDGFERLRWSWPRYRLLSRSAQSFESTASFSTMTVTLTGVDDPEPVPGELVSAAYFPLLRVRPALGRTFAPDADDPATPPAVVIGHGLWQRRFGGDTSAVGRTMNLNGVPFTIIGVAPANFTGLSGKAAAWVPSVTAPRITYAQYLTTNQNFIMVAGRLRNGVSPPAAARVMALVGARIHETIPNDVETPADRFAATFASLNDVRVNPTTRRALMYLLGAVGLLLVIACANVASLFLGRAAERRREIAVRLALGATRTRLVRLLLAESAWIAIAAGLLGTLIAAWAVDVIRVPSTLASGGNFWGTLGEFASASIDWRVLTFAVLVCAATTLGFGLAPALRATRADLVSDLKSGPLTAGGKGHRWPSLRELAVSLEVALAIVLLVGAGLLLASFRRLRDQPSGFNASNVLTFQIRPSEVKYPTERAPQVIERVLAEIERLPSVESATVDGCTPLSTGCAVAGLRIVGADAPAGSDPPLVRRHYVGPHNFDVLEIPVLRGRSLLPSDRAGAPRVVVINQAAAKRFWPNADPIGRRIWFEGASGFGSPDSSAEIVGIVGDAAYEPFDRRAIHPDFFTSYAQFTYASRTVLVRTRGNPLLAVTDVAAAVRRADPDLALFDVQTMEQRAGLSWSKQAFQTGLTDLFGGIAILLAAIGIYAVTAQFVAQRTREFGIRIALGARVADIARASTDQTVRLAAIGLAVGVPAAAAGAWILRSTLYDTSPFDLRVLAAVALVILLVMVVATYVPARRALRVNPVEALRAD